MNINPNYEIQVMKIIHTSDWHLGQIFNDYDRTEEHAAFLRRLTDIVKEERPDALLVSGDIFHNSTPSSAVQRFYTDAFLELKNACPGMTVVITAGNHDSPSRLEIDRNLWNCMGVKVVGSVSKQDGEADLEKHIIEIPSGDGGVAGYVIALPHIYRQNYPASMPEPRDTHSQRDTDTFDGADDRELSRQKAFYKALLETVSRRNPSGLPVVMMAHLAVSGCDISGHEEPIGGMEYTSLDTFPQGYDYLALGHIHHPQTLNRRTGAIKDTDGPEVYSSPVARYSGSPVAVSFDEDYCHSVSVVKISAPDDSGKKIVGIKEVEIPQEIPVVTLPSCPVPFEDALDALSDFPDDRKAYIRLNVLVSDYLPQNASLRAIEAAGQKECRYCNMKITRESMMQENLLRQLSVDEIKTGSPVDIARLYYKGRFGTDMDSEMESMLEETVMEEMKKVEE